MYIIIFYLLTLSLSPVNLDLLGADVREFIKGMKLATGELVNNKQNKKLKVNKQVYMYTHWAHSPLS